MLGANDVRLSRLMDRREAPGRKRMGIRSPDGAARHPLYSPPACFLLYHLLLPPTTFVRFASAPSPRTTRSARRSPYSQFGDGNRIGSERPLAEARSADSGGSGG